MIGSCEEHTGDVNDIKRACKQVMNKAVTKRTISKQEACVLLAELPLVTCTETIESMSISNSKAPSLGDEDRNSATQRTFINQYKSRPPKYETYSLHRYFFHLKNNDESKQYIMPHFVGINGAPKFPVTPDNARHTIIVYMPWRQYPKYDDWVDEFERFIHSKDCTPTARLTYEGVMQQHMPKASQCDHGMNPISPNDEELMCLHGRKRHDDDFDEEDVLYKQMHKGESFDWGSEPKVRHVSG
jgi:hypothetical protein